LARYRSPVVHSEAGDQVLEAAGGRVVDEGAHNLGGVPRGDRRLHVHDRSKTCPWTGSLVAGHHTGNPRNRPDGAELAIDFALSANRLVEELAPELPLRDPDGSPIHMGWGVVHGKAALAAMTRSVEAVIGDATNVAFRLAGARRPQRAGSGDGDQ
jgi:class 3 adenylate cyclase